MHPSRSFTGDIMHFDLRTIHKIGNIGLKDIGNFLLILPSISYSN